MNQDPYLLHTGKLASSGPCVTALSPDGRTVAIAQDACLYMWNSSGKDKKIVEDLHSGKTCGTAQ